MLLKRPGVFLAHLCQNTAGPLLISLFIVLAHQPFGQQYHSSLLQWVADNTWTAENTNAKLPRVTFVNEKQNQCFSNLWDYDSKYLRLKNVEIGYTIRQPRWFKSLSSARFYLNGTNLLTFSKFDTWDPEMGSSNGQKYPITKGITLGVQVNL